MSISDKVALIASNPMIVIIGMLFVFELVYYTDHLTARQKSFNWVSLICMVLLSVPWTGSLIWLKVVFSLAPFILNVADIFHLKGEKWFLTVNTIETLFLLLLSGWYIFALFRAIA